MKKLTLSSAQYDALYLLVYCEGQTHQLKDNVRSALVRKGYTVDSLGWDAKITVTDSGRAALEHDQDAYRIAVYGEA